MKTSRLIALATAALLASVAAPAIALDVSVGGVSVSGGSSSGGGTTVSTGTGDTSASATIGGGSNIATVSTGTGGTGVSAGIGNTSGDLVTVNSNDSTTDANVNLGSLGLGGTSDLINGVTDPLGTTLDGVDLGDLGDLGGGGGGGGAVLTAFNGLAGGDQQRIRLTCRAVLADPSGFNAQTIALCRLLATR